MVEKIREEHLEDISQDYYYEYGVATNEDRSVPSNIDGLKPVARRVLWAAYNMGSRHNSKVVKAARIVGETMGKYHPHGDKAIYDTMVGMVNSVTPTIQGQGNWGTLSDPNPAAQRYTESRINKYAEKVFFDPFYLPVADLIPNYDGMNKEPLILPALLPNLLLNGSFGIGVGVSTSIPSFTLDSLLKVITKGIQGQPVDYKLCKKYLVFSTKHGGVAIPDSSQEKQFYKTGKGKIQFKSIHQLDPKKNSIIIDKFAPLSNLGRPLEKSSELKEVVKANDITDKKTKSVTVQIDLKRTLKGSVLQKVIDKVVGFFSVSENYDVKVTKRFIDKNGKPVSKLSNSTVPQIIKDWIDYRIDLEKKACAFWVKKAEDRIAHLNLMRIAVKNRATILKALDKKCSEEDLEKYIAKELKISIEQAKEILDTPVRKLRSLEDDNLVKLVKEKETEKKELNKRIKDPNSYVETQITKLVNSL